MAWSENIGRHGVEPAAPRRFPWAVAVVCGGLALALFLTNTVPALAERDQLRAVDDRCRQLLEMLQGENEGMRKTLQGLDADPQTVLVELDKLGLTPQEALARRAQGAGERLRARGGEPGYPGH